MDRTVIHLNVADFPVAVERAVDRRLRDRPVIIAPDGSARATVYDMSEEAFQAGVRKGMPLRRAVRRCRDARILTPRPHRYEQAMEAMRRQALAYSPLIEAGDGDGHLFVEATGTRRLFGSGMDVAWRLRKEARKDLGFDPIWSVAPNKLVAKVASRLVKPTGEYIVDVGEEEAFLAPVPVDLVPGIEADDLCRLREFNLFRVFQVAAWSLGQLEVPFGARARFIYEAVRGIDPSPVRPAGERPPRLVADHTFGEDAHDLPILESALYRMIEQTGRKLRDRRLAARRVAVVLDYSDGIRRIRQAAPRPASANDLTLYESARRAMMSAWNRRTRIRHMRLICDRLTFPPAQLELFPSDARPGEKRTDLIAAVDRIRDRFGAHAVRLGRTLPLPA